METFRVIIEKYGSGLRKQDSEQKPMQLYKYFPNVVRAAIVGPSNFGKTNLLVKILTDPNGIAYSNIYLYSKSLDQQEYINLENFVRSKELKKENINIGFFTYNSPDDVIRIEDIPEFSVMIFDDVASDK